MNDKTEIFETGGDAEVGDKHMASHQELLIEWTMLDGDHNNWTVQDLQLAAEIGRSLLERNEELENEIKQQQSTIDDQAQEIEYLTKQTSSMKEEITNRAKFYEQLESSIYDLERKNSQLSRKHEVDKKRIESLCENIDYLERKCEEMTGTLQSITEQQNKKRQKRSKRSEKGDARGGLSNYSSLGSESSEEELNGLGLSYALHNRRKTHSLHDLRDLSSSPEDTDSKYCSQSPELKTSEVEFIETLESRVYQLSAARKEESDKIQQLENQVRLLVQENTNLQQQIIQVTKEKDGEIAVLTHRLSLGSVSSLADLETDENAISSSTNVLMSSKDFISPSSVSSTSNNQKSDINNVSVLTNSLAHKDQKQGVGHGHRMSSPTFTSSRRNSVTSSSSTCPKESTAVGICKRCAAEVNLLNIVNSIEVEDTDESEYPYFGDEQDGEFSSLEHELAKASSGSHHMLFDHKSFNMTPVHHSTNSGNDENNLINQPWNEYSDNGKPCIESSNPFHRKIFGNKTFKKLLEDSPSQIDIAELDYYYDTNEEFRELDEDPCILKDKEPEFHNKESEEQMSGSGDRLALITSNDRDLQVPQRTGSSDNLPKENNVASSSIISRAKKIENTGSVSSKPTKSKLWWFAWVLLVVLGVFELIWAMLSLSFFLLAAAIFPSKGKQSTCHLASSSSSSSPSLNGTSEPNSGTQKFLFFSASKYIPTIPYLTSTRKL